MSVYTEIWHALPVDRQKAVSGTLSALEIQNVTVNAGPRPSRDKFGLGYGLSPEIIVDPHLLTAGTRVRVWSQQALKGTVAAEPARQKPLSPKLRHCTAYPGTWGSQLGPSLKSERSCPDPRRLSTLRVNGLCPCRRLSEVLADKCCTPRSTDVNPHVRQLSTLDEFFMRLPLLPRRV